MPGVGADDGSCADHPKQLGPPAEILVDEVGHYVFILLRRSVQCLQASRTPSCFAGRLPPPDLEGPARCVGRFSHSGLHVLPARPVEAPVFAAVVSH